MSARNWRPSDDETARLARLADLAAERARQDELVAGQVAWLRSHDVPWRAIAADLGVSPQAAQQRYGR